MTAREPGTILDDKYEVVRRLGSGGMGEVYLVRHVHLQELRVVKILRQDLAADPVAQKRFVREARLATQIKHPNVAILYDFSRLPDGSFYMVWEHIQGQDVGDWLRQRGPFPVSTAIRLAIQALRGLGAIHAAGIVHRDLSPDNLMIMENNRQQAWLKIIDLGLAKNLEQSDGNLEITQAGTFMGKLQYCSPEQAGAATGEVLDGRSDLYSFALVLYEMVTGLPPFESDSPHGFIFKRLSEQPLPMVGRNPRIEVPVELDRLVRQALERDRDRRLPDSVSFIVALEKVEQGLQKVETREVVMSPEARAAVLAATPAAGSPRPTAATTPATATGVSAAAARPRTASELSRAEKLDLLAQIERAAKRVSESSIDLARVEGAIAAGRLDDAQRRVAQIESTHPRSPGLEALKERLAQASQAAGAPVPQQQQQRAAALAPERPAPAPPPAPPPPVREPPAPAPSGPVREPPPPSSPPVGDPLPTPRAPIEGAPPVAGVAVPGSSVPAAATAAPGGTGAGADVKPGGDPGVRQRVEEAERVLRRYLERKQLPLARLALETLLELAPHHPNRADYESWVNLLAEEVDQDRRADVALQAGRAAITRRDFAAARRELATVARNDLTGKRAEELANELEAAEQMVRQGAEFEAHKKRLTELLAAHKLVEAEAEIGHLAALGLSNITLDSFRERLAEARRAAGQERLTAPIEKRYRERREARDWFGAREATAEMEQALPASPRAAAMYAEIERLEAIHRHQQAVEQGVQQVDAFLAKGDIKNAELAFRVLLNIDPENRHRKRIERQLRAGRP